MDIKYKAYFYYESFNFIVSKRFTREPIKRKIILNLPIFVISLIYKKFN